MSAAESPLRPLAWAIVYAASMWLVISGSLHRHDQTGMALMGVGLLTGLVALLNINSWRWIDNATASKRKDLTVSEADGRVSPDR